MNDITRQFRILLRKIRLDIHVALSELHSLDPTREEYDPDDDTDTTEKEEDVIAAIKALQYSQGTAEAKKYALDHRRYRLEWKAYRAARLTLIAIFIYTGLNLIIAYHSKRSADAAKDAASAARTANQDAANRFIQDQRPYLGVTPIPGSQKFILGKRFAWNFKVTNFGRTPAVKIRYCGLFMFLHATRDLDPDGLTSELPPPSLNICTHLHEPNQAPQQVLAPTDSHYFTGTLLDPKRRVTKDDLKLIERYDGSIIFYGVYLYEDQRANSYSTTFCTYSFASGAIAFCPKYNDMK